MSVILSTKSQETTNARNDARNDIITTASSVKLSNYINNISSNIECPEYEFPSSSNQKKADSKYQENE